jgi:hypothetical protein
MSNNSSTHDNSLHDISQNEYIRNVLEIGENIVPYSFDDFKNSLKLNPVCEWTKLLIFDKDGKILYQSFDADPTEIEFFLFSFFIL